MKAKCQYLHTDNEGEDYISSRQIAKEKAKAGEKQKQCPACGLWKWESEILKLSEHFTTERVN